MNDHLTEPTQRAILNVTRAGVRGAAIEELIARAAFLDVQLQLCRTRELAQRRTDERE